MLTFATSSPPPVVIPPIPPFITYAEITIANGSSDVTLPIADLSDVVSIIIEPPSDIAPSITCLDVRFGGVDFLAHLSGTTPLADYKLHLRYYP